MIEANPLDIIDVRATTRRANFDYRFDAFDQVQASMGMSNWYNVGDRWISILLVCFNESTCLSFVVVVIVRSVSCQQSHVGQNFRPIQCYWQRSYQHW